MIDGIDLAAQKKICVIGAPGAGKTYFATVLAQSLGRPVIALDEIRFAPRRAGRAQNSPAMCKRQLAHILKIAPEWIIEGTAWQPWTEKAIADADIVLVVCQGPLRRSWRILGRWMRNNQYRRGIKSTLGLIRISWTYDRDRLPVILARAAAHKTPVYVIRPTPRDNQNRKWRLSHR